MFPSGLRGGLLFQCKHVRLVCMLYQFYPRASASQSGEALGEAGQEGQGELCKLDEGLQ